MSLWLEDGQTFREWDGREKIGKLSYQPNIGDLWPAEELAAIGLYEPVVPEVPVGKVVESRHVERVNGVVTFVNTYRAGPLLNLNRIQFRFMTEKLGLGAAIEGAIASMPENTEAEQNAKILARLLYTEGQDFHRDHPLFSTLSVAIGLTSDQIDAIWLVAMTV